MQLNQLNNLIVDKINNGILVETLVQYGANVVTYEKIKSFKDIRDLSGYIIYMPVETKNFGHYITIWFNRDATGVYDYTKLFYFDSYGYSPEQTVRHSSYMKKTPERDEYYLLNLIISYKRQGGLVSYNSKQLQKLEASTCARHCLIRLLYSHLSHADYEKFLKFKSLNPDELVTLMTVSL